MARAGWRSTRTRSSFHFSCCHHWRSLSKISSANMFSKMLVQNKVGKKKKKKGKILQQLLPRSERATWLLDYFLEVFFALGLWKLPCTLSLCCSHRGQHVHSWPPCQQLDLQLKLIRIACSFSHLGWGCSKQLEARGRLISLLCRQRQMWFPGPLLGVALVLVSMR